MKRTLTILLAALITSTAFGQLDYFWDFETDRIDTVWTVFDNGADGSDADIDLVANPWADDVNDSDSVLSFLVREDAKNWVGMYTDTYSNTSITESNYQLALMVNKEVLSPVRLKIERSSNGGSDLTIENENEKLDEWELLVFDFSEAAGYSYDRLSVFPDRPASGEREYGEHTVYIDNIGVPSSGNTATKDIKGKTMMLYPTPAEYRMAVSYPGTMTGITLHDLMGRQIEQYEFAATDNKVLKTEHLKSGIYFVTADTPDGKISVRFLKK